MEASHWLLVHLLIFSQVSGAEASAWTVTLPTTIRALPGSCVVIPCSYSYPDSPSGITKFTGIWMNTTNHVIFHPVLSKIQPEFENRTALLGDISQNNCSLNIDALRQTDQGPFYFRIEMKNYNSYSFSDNTVSITMKSRLTPVSFTLNDVDNETLTASCSVSHSCPSSPPVFTWSRSGLQHSYPHQLDGGQWTLTSALTFHPTHADHRQKLQCTVTYRGGQQQRASKILDVKYAPVKVVVDHDPNVKEGESVRLVCGGSSNPPATRFHWYNHTGEFLSSGKSYTLQNVSRHARGVFCSALNTIGSGNSSTVQLNVSYSPDIKPMSTCFIHQTVVRCVCVVESNPPSTVHFLLLDKVVPSNIIERHGHIAMATLDTDLRSAESVSCQAENTMGRSDAKIPSPGNRKMKTIYIITFIAAAAIFVVVFTVLLRKWSKTSTSVFQLSTLLAQKTPTSDLACSSTSKGVDDNASELSVCSEPVYGNMEQTHTEDDGDAVYANM